TVPNVAFDLTVGTRGIPEGKVVHPSFQAPIQLSDQDWDRLMALMTVGHLAQLLPFPLDRLFRWEHVQVFSFASFQITVIPQRITHKLASPTGLLSPIHSDLDVFLCPFGLRCWLLTLLIPSRRMPTPKPRRAAIRIAHDTP